MRESARATRRAISTSIETSSALEIAEQNAATAARQLDISQETAKRQLRAYIHIQAANTQDLVPGGKPQIRLLFKNTGQTPAREVVIHFRIGVAVPDATALYKGRMSLSGSRVTVVQPLGPGEVSGYVEHLSWNITDSELKMLSSGAQTILVWVASSYRDIFGVKHRTVGFYRLPPEEIKESGLSMLAPCARDNLVT